MSSLNRTASGVIRERATGLVIMETFSSVVVRHLKAQYEAVPILEYLQSLNRK
jgi:hypothetical protein